MFRLFPLACLLAGCGWLLTVPSAATAQTYELDTSFSLVLPEGLQLGAVPGVAFDSHGHLIVSHRGPRPILVYDKQGKLIQMFGDNELTAVHGTRVDAEDNIWVTDHKNHTVIKYSPAGEVLMVLGRRDEKGETEELFNRPTDVAFAPNGDFFVSDGYGNSRVVKFNQQGKFLKAWGVEGSFTGQFKVPHGVFIDNQNLLHVADRENDRIQVFDLEGNFVRLYGGFAPFGTFILPDQTLLIADGRAHKFLHMTLEGKMLAQCGSEGTAPGQFDLPHGIAADAHGNVYVTEITGRRIQRFLRR